MCTYIFFHLETFDLLFLIGILPTMGRIYNVVDQNKYVKKVLLVSGTLMMVLYQVPSKFLVVWLNMHSTCMHTNIVVYIYTALTFTTGISLNYEHYMVVHQFRFTL